MLFGVRYLESTMRTLLVVVFAQVPTPEALVIPSASSTMADALPILAVILGLISAFSILINMRG